MHAGRILAERQIRITQQLVRQGYPPPDLRLPPAKLSLKSNWVARGRICWFESYMPSHAVRLPTRPLITLRRGFPSRSDAEDYPVRLSLWRRVWVERELSEPNSSLMTYEGIDYAIRAGLGRNEWVLLLSFPDNAGGNPSVVNFSGSRNDALAEAKKRINNWMKRLKKKRRAACSVI